MPGVAQLEAVELRLQSDLAAQLQSQQPRLTVAVLLASSGSILVFRVCPLIPTLTFLSNRKKVGRRPFGIKPHPPAFLQLHGHATEFRPAGHKLKQRDQ